MRLNSVRLHLETLEDRTCPSSLRASSVHDLLADIRAANHRGGSNTISLAPGKTFTLAKANNYADGSTGLPIIAANDDLTIVGNGDTIERSGKDGTDYFRLFDVAAGASLTLERLTLQGGFALGGETIVLPAAFAEGGAIYNQGALDLNGVTVENNIAAGRPPLATGLAGPAAGGAIYSSGSLTLEGGTQIQDNQAYGGSGFVGSGYDTGHGGAAMGGGIYSSGSLTLEPGAVIQNNQAIGGYYSGAGLGGGLYVAGGAATVFSVIFSANATLGGKAGPGHWIGVGKAPGHRIWIPGSPAGSARGGGLYAGDGNTDLLSDTLTGGIFIHATAALSLDAFTAAHEPDISGSWTLN